MVGGKSQKSMCGGRNAQPDRPPVLSRLCYVPVIIGTSFSSCGTPPHRRVVQHFRLTGVSRASGEKRPGWTRRRYHALPPQIATRVFSGEAREPKNVPSHRGWVNFQKKKKNITLSSLCVKRSGRKCKRR